METSSFKKRLALLSSLIKKDLMQTPDCEGYPGWVKEEASANKPGMWACTEISTIDFLCCFFMDRCIGEKALMC